MLKLCATCAAVLLANLIILLFLGWALYSIFKVIAWLEPQHWNIYQEVQFRYSGGVADIVAERHGILWIIETKTRYDFTVLRQATQWPVHFRSVAVPRAKDRDYAVAEYWYKVGVITVADFEGADGVNEVVRPPLFRTHHKQAQHMATQLLELHKTFAAAGSAGGQHLTPYKLTMMEVKKQVSANPGCTIRFLYEQLGEMHYASKSSFMGNLVKCLVDFEGGWCRVDRNVKPFKLYPREGVST